MFNFGNTQPKIENDSDSIVYKSQVEAQIEPQVEVKQVEAQTTYYDSLCCDEAPPSMKLSHKRPRSYMVTTSHALDIETPTNTRAKITKFSRSSTYPGKYSPVCQAVFRRNSASGSDIQESIGNLSSVDSYDTAYQKSIQKSIGQPPVSVFIPPKKDNTSSSIALFIVMLSSLLGYIYHKWKNA